MDNATEEKYFEKIDEFIKDDDVIVTVPFLCRSLNISLSQSQHVLSRYAKQQKLKSNELYTTYILTGLIKGSGKAVIIVKECDLDQKRKSFDNVVSEVLFSVQKCKKIDFTVLSLVDDVTEANKEPLLGSIASKNCTKRVLKLKKLAAPPPPTIKGKSSFFLPKSQSSTKTDKSSETIAKSGEKSKENGSVKVLDKASPPANKTNSEKKSESIKTKNKGGLSAFFSKSASTSNSSIKSETSIKTELSSDTENLPSALEELMEVDFQELDDMENSIKKEENKVKEDVHINKNEKVGKEDKKKETKKSEEKAKKTKNKRQRERSEEKSLKKRKRIIQRNDSESDDLFENDDEDVIDKSDSEIEIASSPKPIKPLAPKNKIRKAVDKTYMDDEGFIVTKTEYVFESAPEDDQENPTKTEIVEKPKLEKKTSASSENDASPKGAKSKKGKKNSLQNQPTLMNFFKKK